MLLRVNHPSPTIRLTDARAEHGPAIEQLLDAAFGEARWTKTCQLLRDGQAPLPGLSLVALSGGALIGVVRVWRVQAGRKRTLLLGPLAVTREWRERGVGGKLIKESLRRAKAAGEDSVLLVGDAPYYGRFGFKSELTRDLELPGPVDPAWFLGCELKSGALARIAGPIAKLAA